VFHNELKEEGLAGATSDHYVKLLRRAFNLAIEWGFVDKNPASRVKLFNLDNKVEHYLDEDQLQKLLKVLRTDSSRPVCMIAMFLLSTGARLSEALHAKWEQVDARHRVWRIPAINSKSKRMRSVPLNDSAIDILKQLDSEGESDYLFVNRQTGKPYAAVHKVWERLRNEAGLPHLRIHDLRHQYASFLVNSGRTLYEVQQILGHSDPTVTQRYAHLSSKSLQEAANSASVIINEAMLATT
jgi:integrase